jgi:Fe-S oxidoreductase
LKLVEVFEKAREWLLIEKMLGPMPEQVNVLKNMHVRGNPWGNPSHERTKWADGLDIAFASIDNQVEVLYFVDCASSYDPRAQRIAKNLAKIFKKAQVSFGILEKEVCSGSEALRMGETGLFEYLSTANMEMFEAARVKHIVTGDPHSFFSFTHEYPNSADKIRYQHYTQFLNDLLDSGRLKLLKEVNRKVTYHDPCYLGRHSEVFDAPRRLIGRIPGVIFTEMETHGRDSECCGMGGGRMWMEPPKGMITSQMIAEKRVTQALTTGMDILLTACPFCNVNLHDAVKSLGKEGEIEVMDITELFCMAM